MLYVNAEFNNYLKLIFNCNFQQLFLPPKEKPEKTCSCVEECSFKIFGSIMNLAKDKFHGLILVPVPTKGCHLGSRSQESKPLNLTLQTRHPRNNGLDLYTCAR